MSQDTDDTAELLRAGVAFDARPRRDSGLARHSRQDGSVSDARDAGAPVRYVSLDDESDEEGSPANGSALQTTHAFEGCVDDAAKHGRDPLLRAEKPHEAGEGAAIPREPSLGLASREVEIIIDLDCDSDSPALDRQAFRRTVSEPMNPIAPGMPKESTDIQDDCEDAIPTLLSVDPRARPQVSKGGKKTSTQTESEGDRENVNVFPPHLVRSQSCRQPLHSINETKRQSEAKKVREREHLESEKEQERERKRAAKERESLRKKLGKERQQYERGKDALANISLVCDVSLATTLTGNAIQSALLEKGVKFEQQRFPVENLVLWKAKRRVYDDVQLAFEEKEGWVHYLAVYFSAKAFLQLIDNNTLDSTFENIRRKFPDFVVHILTDGLEIEIKRLKQKTWKELSRCDPYGLQRQAQVTPSAASSIEQIMARLMFSHSSFRFRDVRDKEEAAVHMLDLTRALAEEPFKADDDGLLFKRNIPKACASFSAWQAALMQVPGVSANAAEAIAQEYPGMFSLLYRYETLERNEGESLLANIRKRIPVGTGSDVMRDSERRIGPKLSRRIYNFFTADSPEEVVEGRGQ
mmetsp:Transcript_11574/g.42331  ORF Transcript_11574/g.42331 Transcript_11574/m.42331 type:complete len:582 (+) Transcript_11574:173-1918(+)